MDEINIGLVDTFKPWIHCTFHFPSITDVIIFESLCLYIVRLRTAYVFLIFLAIEPEIYRLK